MIFVPLLGLLAAVLLASHPTSASTNDVVLRHGRKAPKLNFARGQQNESQQQPVHLVITSVVTAPFMMIRKKPPGLSSSSSLINVDNQLTTSNASGQLEWYGYCVDLLEELIKYIPYQVSYEIYQSSSFGIKRSNKDEALEHSSNTSDAGRQEPKMWDGLVGELQRGNAHLALATLSVMAERELIIDFTVPFYDLVGGAILIKRTQVEEDNFKFLTVLDGQVWVSIFVAYLVASVAIFLFGRLSPYSVRNSSRLSQLRRRQATAAEIIVGHQSFAPPPGAGAAPSAASASNLRWSWRDSFAQVRRRSSLFLDSLMSPQQQQQHYPFERQRPHSTILPAGLAGHLPSLVSLGSLHEQHDQHEQHDFSLRDSLWFCITSLTPQGGGQPPSNLSGRLVAGAWWLFCFIIIALYTANLAAYLTVSKLDIPIESMDDLIKQYRIKYAPIKNTAENAYFERMANIEEIFYNIWKRMSLNESLSEEERAKFAVWDYPISDKYTKVWAQITQTGLPNDLEEGLARVKASNFDEGFALLLDANVIRYLAMTDCSLKSVGDEFSRKPIAIGVQKNLGRLRDDISQAILQLINKRFMEKLREKWWTNNPDRVVCENADESEGISIKNIGGIFIIIVGGVFVSFFVWSIERYVYRASSAEMPQVANDDFPDSFAGL